MNAIGVVFAVLLSLPWTLFMAVVSLASFLVNERLGHRMHRLWAQGVLLAFGIRVKVLFAHQIPTTGGVILAPNHQSAFDIPILASLPIDFKWISKEEVRRIPAMGWAMVKMGCFFVSRRNSTQDMNVLKGVEDGLRRGKRVVIFPEGTRTRDGKLQPLKKGAFRLAQNSGVPLCPVAISGSYAIAAPKRLPSRRGFDVTVRMGAPLLSGPGDELSRAMDKYLKELVRLLEEGDAS